MWKVIPKVTKEVGNCFPICPQRDKVIASDLFMSNGCKLLKQWTVLLLVCSGYGFYGLAASVL